MFRTKIGPAPIGPGRSTLGVVNLGRIGLLAGAGALLLVACADDPEAAPATGQPSSTVEPTAPSTTPAATTSPAVTTTTAEPAKKQRKKDAEPVCVVTVEAGDSLAVVAESVDEVSLDQILDENRISLQTVIHPGDQLDVCIGNDVDDVTGSSRLPAGPQAVRRQQIQLNELFAPYMIADLAVDGDSGPLTRQMLCAARMGLGLPIHAGTMSVGSEEATALFAADSIRIPAGAATWANRWILIDKTCQVVFTGEGDDRIVNVFPTSTGQEGYETHNVTAAAFRYDPAVDNGGWHDSSAFPVAIDNPLNGNMYKPLYFNNGQAIHGANNVPPEPRSKGCARLYPWHHDTLVEWLGLDGLREATWRRSHIGVAVAAQCDYRDEC